MDNPSNNQKQSEERQSQIADYLQAPRKKRKNYVFFALGSSFPRALKGRMKDFVQKAFPQLAIAEPVNSSELGRLFGRNISLVIVDHHFDKEETVFRLIKALKEKRAKEIIPVLFLTNSPEKLIKMYNQFLLKYQSTDDYVEYEKSSTQKVLSRIKLGIEVAEKSQLRPYTIKHKISFFHLDYNQTFQAEVIDLNIHGGQIVALGDCIFKEDDQIKITMPINKLIKSDRGDFLKISARVRRVFIGGTHAAISFEHVTDMQRQLLTKVLMAIVSDELSFQTKQLKISAALRQKNMS